jgi:hypothetical protein
MFKTDWEKTSVTYQLPEVTIEKMVRLAYPDKKLTSSELIAGGCANLNFKIQLENEKHPLILRVYLCNKVPILFRKRVNELESTTSSHCK